MELHDQCDNTKNSKSNLAETSKKGKRWYRVSSSYCMAMELAALIVTTIIVWSLFSLPSVFYLSRPGNNKVDGFLFVVCTNPIDFKRNKDY